ncbi:bifunctional aspartate transaminase/aspartate 4-decarboxylase [Ruegeria sp. 2205SS24-7]|uniref:bifunctional aspartate transaminase/aspartate 4-decarboxylase n=1 Tax=Ruegeria discodermiae TaxID=3064389 RepID=UPI002740D691|nr:bifunctional aspartate transaminase/aspartate 4-decarboxylase [Ruegeria sp. 2205SS24-7]MDP5219494.1 bifunctional aspartate transaminase/aspartate 4-decarboxylase [Ruegeria sp. 2205SS24-7]
MDDLDIAKLADLSPFELKDKLIEIASSDADRMMLNAGRGNPNFLATLPRRAFLRLGEFAMQEAERSYSYLNSGFGGLPDADGIVQRFDAFSNHNDSDPGVTFIQSAISYVRDQLGLDRKAFLSEAVGAFLGCNYPVPPRMLSHAEEIVKAYIAQEMYGPVPQQGDFSLFATEGGTAAMTYIFQTLKNNLLVDAGDKVALGTPIFSPYLEIPPLPGYDLEIVDIRMDEEDDWQFPEAEIKKLEDPAVKVFCVVNPSNPPSAKLSQASLDQIADLVNGPRKDLIIITDDVYGTFADDFVSLFARCPRNTLCVYSFSKYFGATGWRLGVIGLHEENAIDTALAKLSEDAKRTLDRRYMSLTTEPRALRFIDRLVADSRAVALNHTAGLSLPQQLQMTLFALNGLMDIDGRYKEAAKRLVRHRFDTLYKHMGTVLELDDNDIAYYTLIDLKKLAARLHGGDFATWFEVNNKATDFLFRLADETGVVLLPGKGFEVVDPSARVSLANLTEHDYASIGKFARKVIDEYHADYSSETGSH